MQRIQFPDFLLQLQLQTSLPLIQVCSSQIYWHTSTETPPLTVDAAVKEWTMNLGHPELSFACLAVTFLVKIHKCLPAYGQHRTPPSIQSMPLPHPFPKDVCFTVAKFGLNRLRRSPSSLPNRYWQIHRNACMQACRFGPADSNMHSQSPIIQNRHVHHVLHSIPNVYAQRSHKLRNRFHTT